MCIRSSGARALLLGGVASGSLHPRNLGPELLIPKPRLFRAAVCDYCAFATTHSREANRVATRVVDESGWAQNLADL